MSYGQNFSRLVFLALAFGASTGAAKDRFQLVSELFTDFQSSSLTRVFTGYSYDVSGNRVSRSVFDGADTLATGMGVTEYTYDADNLRIQDLLKTAPGDTQSIVRYFYDSNKRQVAMVTLSKTLALRFADSSSYDATGHLSTLRRFDRFGVQTFYHSYAYDFDGKKLSDTLYEKATMGFSAKQTVQFSYDGSNRVSSEANYQNPDGNWYLLNTNKMAYAVDGALTSVTQYDGDGRANLMLDSLAYASDTRGNRTKESHYNQSRALMSTIDYIWLDTQPTMVARLPLQQPRNLASLSTKVFDLSGRRAHSATGRSHAARGAFVTMADGRSITVFTGNN